MHVLAVFLFIFIAGAGSINSLAYEERQQQTQVSDARVAGR